jgi:hypothetical protein
MSQRRRKRPRWLNMLGYSLPPLAGLVHRLFEIYAIFIFLGERRSMRRSEVVDISDQIDCGFSFCTPCGEITYF